MIRACTNCGHRLGDEIAPEYETCDGCFLAIEQVKSGVVELAAPLFDSPWPRSLHVLAGGVRWNWDAEFRVPLFLGGRPRPGAFYRLKAGDEVRITMRVRWLRRTSLRLRGIVIS